MLLSSLDLEVTLGIGWLCLRHYNIEVDPKIWNNQRLIENLNVVMSLQEYTGPLDNSILLPQLEVLTIVVAHQDPRGTISLISLILPLLKQTPHLTHLGFQVDPDYVPALARSNLVRKLAKRREVFPNLTTLNYPVAPRSYPYWHKYFLMSLKW